MAMTGSVTSGIDDDGRQLMEAWRSDNVFRGAEAKAASIESGTIYTTRLPNSDTHNNMGYNCLSADQIEAAALVDQNCTMYLPSEAKSETKGLSTFQTGQLKNTVTEATQCSTSVDTGVHECSRLDQVTAADAPVNPLDLLQYAQAMQRAQYANAKFLGNGATTAQPTHPEFQPHQTVQKSQFQNSTLQSQQLPQMEVQQPVQDGSLNIATGTVNAPAVFFPTPLKTDLPPQQQQVASIATPQIQQQQQQQQELNSQGLQLLSQLTQQAAFQQMPWLLTSQMAAAAAAANPNWNATQQQIQPHQESRGDTQQSWGAAQNMAAMFNQNMAAVSAQFVQNLAHQKLAQQPGTMQASIFPVQTQAGAAIPNLSSTTFQPMLFTNNKQLEEIPPTVTNNVMSLHGTVTKVPLAKNRRHYRHESFPEKLHRMLLESEDGRGDVVSFTASGLAFRIHKPEAFTKEIIPKYFRHKRLASFRRQLSMYGFQRVAFGIDEGATAHPMFLRGNPEWCKDIKRVSELTTEEVTSG